MSDRDSDEAAPPPPRVARHVMPFGPRVLVRILKTADRTTTGLFLPPGAKDAVAQLAYAQVVEVARASSDELEGELGANVSGVPDGSRILFAKDKGLAIPWDESLRLVDTKDVLALVDEVSLDSAH